MIQKHFANRVVDLLRNDTSVIGLAAAGSWITNEIDAYSDLDLILITANKVAGDKQQMLAYARQFGELLTAFTGEHVGEPRLLICLYDNPLLHVDLKFLTLSEFYPRVENPVILLDRDQQLSTIIDTTPAAWPYPDYQWLEDRFWIWVHYTATKLGRGEYFEALDTVDFLRGRVLAPLLHIKNGHLPRGLRKVETALSTTDLDDLKATVAQYNAASILDALRHAIRIYKALREQLFPEDVVLQTATEQKSITYLQEMSTQAQ